MTKKQRDPNEVREVSKDLHYEITMFNTLATTLATGVLGEGTILNSAALESFLMHARNLLEFLFFGPKRRDRWPDLVIAEDFLYRPDEWPTERGEMDPALTDLWDRTGQELMHLTYGRLAVQDKRWYFLELAAAMNAVLERFIALVPTNRLSPECWPSGEGQGSE